MGQVFKGAPPYFSPYIRYRNSVVMPIVGNGAPTDGTAGTGVGKAGPGSLYVDYASGTWYVNTNTKASPTWTAGTTLSGAISGTTGTFSGAITFTTATGSGFIRSTSATTTSGYATGAGGTVTQATDASTGVTLSKPCGQITTVALTTAAGAQERFTVTNTLATATDAIALSTTYNGGGTPVVSVIHQAAGAFDLVITNTHATDALDAAVVVNFAIIKAVAA